MRAEVQQYYWGGKNDAGKKLTPVRHTAGASRGANGKTRRASYANLRDSNIRKTLKVRIKLGHQTIGWSRCPCGLFKENRRIRLDLACRPATRGPEGPSGCPPLRVLAIGRVLAQWRVGGAHVVKPLHNVSRLLRRTALRAGSPSPCASRKQCAVSQGDRTRASRLVRIADVGGYQCEPRTRAARCGRVQRRGVMSPAA
jgi:hypothetical protein